MDELATEIFVLILSFLKPLELCFTKRVNRKFLIGAEFVLNNDNYKTYWKSFDWKRFEKMERATRNMIKGNYKKNSYPINSLAIDIPVEFRSNFQDIINKMYGRKIQ